MRFLCNAAIALFLCSSSQIQAQISAQPSALEAIDPFLINPSVYKANDVKFIKKDNLGFDNTLHQVSYASSQLHFYMLNENGVIEFRTDSTFNHPEYKRFNAYIYNNCNKVSKIESFSVSDDKKQLTPVSISEYYYDGTCNLIKETTKYLEENSSFEYIYSKGINIVYTYKNSENKVESKHITKFLNDNTIELKSYAANNVLDHHAIRHLNVMNDIIFDSSAYTNMKEHNYTYRNEYLNGRLLARYHYDYEGKMNEKNINTFLNNGLIIQSETKFYFEDEGKFQPTNIINYCYVNSKGDSLTNKNIAPVVLPKNELGFLADYNGKYSYDVNLLNNTALRSRLETLMGKRFEYLEEKWMLHYPMEVKNNVFVVNASELHNPGIVDFIITFDLKNNVLSAGIKDNMQYELFSENGEINAALKTFLNN